MAAVEAALAEYEVLHGRRPIEDCDVDEDGNVLARLTLVTDKGGPFRSARFEAFIVARPELRQDIIEHRTSDGKLYLCAIEDVYSNRIVGYSFDSRMKSRLAVAALNNAVARRGDTGGFSLTLSSRLGHRFSRGWGEFEGSVVAEQGP